MRRLERPHLATTLTSRRRARSATGLRHPFVRDYSSYIGEMTCLRRFLFFGIKQADCLSHVIFSVRPASGSRRPWRV